MTSTSEFFKHECRTFHNQFLSFAPPVATMASLLESTASFKGRAISHGLSEDQVESLVRRGVNSLSKLAFAITTPGVTPSEASLRSLLDGDAPDAVTIGDLSALRRLMFDAQTLSIALVKQAVEGGDSNTKVELAPAERSFRIEAQKKRLVGISFQGPYECSFSCYDIVSEMLDKDAAVYPQPHKFGTRASEVAKEKPAKELVIDSGSHVSVRDGKQQTKCSIRNELEFAQALTRRALAFDLMGVCSFSVMEKFHQFLLGYLQMLPPPGYSPVSMEQCMRADRAAWVRISEKASTLKKGPDASCALDKIFPELESDPAVTYHLLPCPGRSAPVNDDKKENKKRKVGDSDETDKKKGKGKGSGKGVPAELRGLSHNTPGGDRICWNFNIKGKTCKFAKPGSKCKRGVHCCMVCFKDHPYHKCPDKS